MPADFPTGLFLSKQTNYLVSVCSLIINIATPRPNMVLQTLVRVLKPSVTTQDRYHKIKEDTLKSRYRTCL